MNIEVDQHIPFVSDPVRTRTILGNLLSNAFKYYNPDVARHHLVLFVSVTPAQATIVLKDNGIGIDDTHKEKIFNMFFRATTRSAGTGLGLYIVKSMVDKLGGEISFESVLNEGTTFQVSIPNHMVARQQTTTNSDVSFASTSG
jgi:signal transduction histidine kinase